MQLIDVECTFDATFDLYFIQRAVLISGTGQRSGPKIPDCIEMRQIGSADEAKLIGVLECADARSAVRPF
jgi:cell fate regulator YaaT (PSP1 superfamily)